MAKAATSIPSAMRSQKELVEEVLNDGIESPSAIVEEVKTRFGVEVAKGNVNQIKVKWKKNKTDAKPAVSTRKKRGPNKPKVGIQGGTSTVDNGFVSDGHGVGNGLIAKKKDTVGNPKTTQLAVEATLVLCKVFGPDAAREIIAAFKENNG